MGAGRRPAGVPYDRTGMGEADRVAHRHAEARLEAAARLEGGQREGRGMGPHERPRVGTRLAPTQLVRALYAAAALTAACSSGRAVTPPPAVAPSPYAPAASQPAAPPTPPAKPRADPVRYGPSAVRYLVHRQLHIQQALGDQNQTQDLGVRIFVALAITGPADAVGYPTTVTVDSMVADSGTPPRVADNLVKVRKLVFAGRVVAKGEVVDAVPSDSALAQAVVQLLGNSRGVRPRLPAGADTTATPR